MGIPKVCLLIDDDPDDQEFFRDALKKIDWPVECHFANNGFEGLEKLRNEPSFIPDYIFLDLNMPRMGGKECLIEIKKISSLSQAIIVIYSTSTESRMQFELIELGAATYMVKPIKMSILVNELNNCFSKF